MYQLKQVTIAILNYVSFHSLCWIMNRIVKTFKQKLFYWNNKMFCGYQKLQCVFKCCLSAVTQAYHHFVTRLLPPITYVVGIQRRSLLFRRVKSLQLLYLRTMVLFCKGQSVDAEMQGILSLMPWTFHQTIRSWYTGHWWVGCYIWYSEEEGTGRAAAPPSPLLAVPNVTAHPSTASVPITVLLYDGPLLCGFNVAIKELNHYWRHFYFAAATLSLLFFCVMYKLSYYLYLLTFM